MFFHHKLNSLTTPYKGYTKVVYNSPGIPIGDTPYWPTTSTKQIHEPSERIAFIFDHCYFVGSRLNHKMYQWHTIYSHVSLRPHLVMVVSVTALHNRFRSNTGQWATVPSWGKQENTATLKEVHLHVIPIDQLHYRVRGLYLPQSSQTTEELTGFEKAAGYHGLTDCLHRNVIRSELSLNSHCLHTVQYIES